MDIANLINPHELFAQLVCFLTVFFLLRVLVWKKFMQILDDRRKRIAEDFLKIEQVKSEAEGFRAELEGKLKNIDQIAAERMKAALEQGKEAAEEIKDRARQEAQQIVSEAKSEIEQTVVKTKETLKKEVVELTILAAEKIIDAKVNEDNDRKFISKFLNDLEKKDA